MISGIPSHRGQAHQPSEPWRAPVRGRCPSCTAHKHTHTLAHAETHSSTRVRTHAIRAYRQTRKQVDTQTHIHTSTHARTHNTHTHNHAGKTPDTHAHSQAYTHNTHTNTKAPNVAYTNTRAPTWGFSHKHAHCTLHTGKQAHRHAGGRTPHPREWVGGACLLLDHRVHRVRCVEGAWRSLPEYIHSVVL